MNKLETRYGYHNTLSSKGKPNKITFDPSKVTQANVWYDSNGNPNTNLYFDDGSQFYCGDDYGAMNGIGHIHRRRVSRKKDL